MSLGGGFTDGSSRRVLGDLLNLPRKRGSSSISDELTYISGDGYDKDGILSKKACFAVDNLGKQKPYVASSGRENNAQISQENTIPFSTGNMSNLGLQSCNGDKIVPNAGSLGDALEDSRLSNIPGPGNSANGKNDCNEEGRTSSEVAQSYSIDGRAGLSPVFSSGTKDVTRLATDEVRRLDRFADVKRDVCANYNSGSDVLKACSCSFCLKAAFILSDLHYKDINGRLAVVKKSLKDTGVVIQKSARGKPADYCGQENSSKSLKLASDLKSKWMSLFRNMEDALLRESNQLQASLVALKDLRASTKMDLEKSGTSYGKS